MTTRRIFPLLFFVATTMFVHCQSNKSDANATQNKETETIIKLNSEGQYAIKSGIVEYKTEMMGMNVKQTLTFDDYGKLERQDVEMEMMGIKMHTASITKDGFIYEIDLIEKTGTKTQDTLINPQDIDFKNLSEEMAKEMNVKKLGTEEFLGKTCEKISIDYQKMQLKGIYLVYKGVVLSLETDLVYVKTKLVAEKFIENPKISSDKFEIPSDIVMED